jgi:hypothetical protein
VFFFEKKNQKTFVFWRLCSLVDACHRAKVFCFCFSEKKIFLYPGSPSAGHASFAARTTADVPSA